MNRLINRFKITALTLSFLSTSTLAADLTLYKSPYCGCCSAWAEHVKEGGFNVTIIEQADNNELRKTHGIKAELASCHTAKIGKYIIEGHVPVADIQRMLLDKPEIEGLTVPGMPASSPGMDVVGNVDPYQVIAFDRNGKTRVFSQYNQ